MESTHLIIYQTIWGSNSRRIQS